MSATGHEEQFRKLFLQEATMLLARLGKDLMDLEEAGSDAELIASIFRDAHTLKGAASVVGLDEVARVAHGMEDLLEGVRSGSRPVTSPLVDALLAAVDALTTFIPAVLAGSAPEGEADRLLDELVGSVDGQRVGEPEPESLPLSTQVPEPDTVSTRAPRPLDVSVPATPAAVERRVSEEAQDSHETIVVPTSRLDDLVRLVGESAAAHLRVGRVLSDRLGVDATTVAPYRDLGLVLNELQERTMRTRMVPVTTITDLLQRGVRDLSRQLGKTVRWEVRGGDTELDRGMLQQLSQPLLHLVRNAVDHGIESPADRLAAGKPEQATVILHAMQLGSEVIITVSDDGRGIDVSQVREKAQQRGEDISDLTDNESLYLIFRSGLSTARVTTNVSGRGVGLDVVRSNVGDIRGRIDVRSTLGVGCEFRIIVPITLAVLPCLLVGVGTERYAIPMHSVVVAVAASSAVDAHAEGRPFTWVDGEPVALSSLATTLGSASGEGSREQQHVVVAASTRRHAFTVDRLLGQRDVVVKGLSRLLPRLDVLAGASVEPDGSILLVLDALGAIDRARAARGGETVAPVFEGSEEPSRRGNVLIVDDALTVRELERSILERAGYQVTTASDGLEALARLAEISVDLVLSDVEMPRMDGIGLTVAIRAHPTLANLPILLLTSLGSDADRQRGLDAGADAYIVKSAFDETSLLSAIGRVLGNAA
ncbi:MAG: CheA signal transduction histidine kinase [Ilumatobacteraceae bacterium]|nr:CheA signal transduction histidine kinase [Ilumatobacteraceae bacterium]